MKKYPRVGEKYKITKPQGHCFLCYLPRANARVVIQTDWFRGNDLVYKSHWSCLSRLKDDEIIYKLFIEEVK